MVTFRHEDDGTPEAHWQGWAGLHALQPLGEDLPARLVVVAAHPDDETLGAGGLIAQTADAGGEVHVVVATAGEASHPHSTTMAQATLARLRATEVQVAVACLSGHAQVYQLGLRDGHLQDDVEQLAATLTALTEQDCWLVAPWRADAHPDHEAAGEAAAACVARHRCSNVRLLEYPVWAWHWGAPGDPRLPWAQMKSIRLSQSARRRKVEAMAAHRTQTEPLSDLPGDEALLSPAMLAHFQRDAEIFVEQDNT